MKLVASDSWRQNSRRNGLRGLSALGDKRALESGIKYASDKSQPSVVRTAALAIVAAGGKGDPRAYPLIFASFEKSLAATNFNGIFGSLQAIIRLADPRGQKAFDMTKAKFKSNPRLNGFIHRLEAQFKAAIK